MSFIEMSIGDWQTMDQMAERCQISQIKNSMKKTSTKVMSNISFENSCVEYCIMQFSKQN